MTGYDFAALNDKEFEVLVADLLSEEYGVHVERFKPGKDAGVDGRWFGADQGEIVVQCKHWVKSGYAALIKSLERNERPKLDRLKPRRYILATSVPLSRHNKNEIARTFAPYLQPADVLGPEDLNLLLARHPRVEERNYKLWLSSIHALRLLVNNAIVGRSRSELALFCDTASIYVKTKDYERAWKHLNHHRVLILTGEPGIGKTTLARQLVLEYVAHGFSLVVIGESVTEAEAVYDESAKQIFYFDDFLGRTYLEALKTKQDSHIVNFVRRIAKDPDKRFVLTSRTNIFNQGTALSDLLSTTPLVKNKYELTIGALTTIERARILYNHIWHSGLEPKYIDELYSNARYHLVISHPNFNPRLIAFMLDADLASGILPEAYWAYVQRTLDNPHEIWDHFFSSQLNQECRDLVFITVLNGNHISEDDLRTSFCSLQSQNNAHAGAVLHAFGIAVKHASGSVLNREVELSSSEVSYSLFNPSIADYVLRYLDEANLWEFYYLHIRSILALRQMEQLHHAWILEEQTFLEIVLSLAAAELCPSARQDGYGLALAGLLATMKGARNEHSELLRYWLLQPDLNVVASEPRSYIRIVLGWRDVLSREEFVDAAGLLMAALTSKPLPLDEPELLKSVLNEFDRLGLDEFYGVFRAMVIGSWVDSIPKLLRDEDLLAGYLDYEEEFESAREELELIMQTRLKEYGIEITSEEKRELRNNVPMSDIISDIIWENLQFFLRDDWKMEAMHQQMIEERTLGAVDDLFDRKENRPARH